MTMELYFSTQAYLMFKQCIHQLFEDQVKLTPQAIAIEFGQQQLTDQELNIQAK
jgi:non-ribosomal peptide synthetase component F